RVPDPTSDKGLRYRSDIAAELIEPLMDEKARPDAPQPETRKLLYAIYLRYGDLLTSLDRPAMALFAYSRAFHLTGDNKDSVAHEHGKWLLERLRAEEVAAGRKLDAVVADPERKGEIANALVELYIAFCRQGELKWKEADEVFAKLEQAGI